MTKLRLYRIQLDLKTKDMAKDLNLDTATISTVERGKARASDRVRLKLSSFFGVAETELFNNERFAV
ncbi:MAG: helix-turn-helix transcriptional regulator [Synergistaceae bacterium]|nr:helix-turn-helix transcriptional regulator [Synergistaceae bacterium]